MADPEFLTAFDRYLFHEGHHYEIYKKMGAHPDQDGMHFAVYAPHAAAVSVVCDRNEWNIYATPMKKLDDAGVYEAFIPAMSVNENYKYAIVTKDGRVLYKADPYAFHAQLRPQTASVTSDLSLYHWQDADWMKKRAQSDTHALPMAIYECHLGSWKKNGPGENDFKTYRQLMKELGAYCKDMGYTHVELMGIAEHPLDASWGYQVTGYYAPTSRYGSPCELMEMVDYLHGLGIGVILDWVPAHFPKDEFGLADFDGEALYEYPDPRMGEHPDWGTKIFNYGKPEIRNFLIANALYWLDLYHIDGLRVDAVASMLYLDYGRKAGEWVPNIYGGNGNLDAISLFKELNAAIADRKDGSIIIAEESTAWPKVTAPVEDGGLGFTYKWNMGWMHDFLDYMKLDPYFRKGSHNKMTFGMSYATSEKFILVLSHDEVVHLKCSMLEKMPGYEVDKFANLKAGYLFQFAHAGKKLLFMGQDFGQNHEWDEKKELDWWQCDEPLHKDLQMYVRDLLHLYRENGALYELDDSWDGFRWMNADDRDRSIYSFVRYNKDRTDSLLVVINFTPVARPDYTVGVPEEGAYSLLFTEQGKMKRPKTFNSVKGECDGQKQHLVYALGAYGCAVFRFHHGKTERKIEK